MGPNPLKTMIHGANTNMTEKTVKNKIPTDKQNLRQGIKISLKSAKNQKQVQKYTWKYETNDRNMKCFKMQRESKKRPAVITIVCIVCTSITMPGKMRGYMITEQVAS